MSNRPWPLVESKTVFDTGLFHISCDRACSPRTGGECDFHVIHMVDWLLTVPFTSDGKVVLVRQYRHGSCETGLELPGGLCDLSGEQPGQGAIRELLEETGYGNAENELLLLGKLRPQPALFSNHLWVFLAKDVALKGRQTQDAGEDIDVVLMPPEQIQARIAVGEINNAMTVAALFLAQLAGHLS